MPLQKQRSRFLSAVHGTVAVAKAGNGADNGEIGQVRESEHFGSDADRSEPCIGSTAENGGIAECGGEYRRDTEQRGKCCTKAGTDCKQRCDFAALKSNGKGADGEQQLAQKVEPVNGSAVTGEGDQIGAQSGVSAVSGEQEKHCQYRTAEGNANHRVGEQLGGIDFSLFQQQGEDAAHNAGGNPQQQNRHGKRCEAGFGKCHLKGFQPQCDGDPVCCHCGNGGRQQGTIFQFPDCQHFQCKADCRQRCVKQPAETGSHSGNGQNGNGIGNAPEPRNPAADVVGNRGSQLYSDTLSSGTAAAEMCQPRAADQKRDQPEGNAFCSAVRSIKDQAHALTAFSAVFLVYPYHADTGNGQKGNTRDQVLCPECTDPQQHTPESGGECTGDTAGSCRQHTEQQSGENKLQFDFLHRQYLRKKKKLTISA